MKGGISDPKLGHGAPLGGWSPQVFGTLVSRHTFAKLPQGIPLTSSIAPLMSSRRSCRFLRAKPDFVGENRVERDMPRDEGM